MLPLQLPSPSGTSLGSAKRGWAAGGSLGRRAKQLQLIPVVLCPQGDRAQTYCELESVLWGDDSRLQCGVVNRLIAEVSRDLTADQVRWCSWKAVGAACQAF